MRFQAQRWAALWGKCFADDRVQMALLREERGGGMAVDAVVRGTSDTINTTVLSTF
jgi:hypothetical protein